MSSRKCKCGKKFNHRGVCWAFNSKEICNLRNRYEQGATTRQLEKDTGHDHCCVAAAIRRAGGKIRTLSESKCVFGPNQAAKLRKMHEEGKSLTYLAIKFNTCIGTVTNSVRRAGGKTRPKEVFRTKHRAKIRKAYDQGSSLRQLAEKWKHSSGAIARAIRQNGGKIRTGFAHRRYYWNSLREQHLWTAYRLTTNDMLFLFHYQKGLCLWCEKLLPLENLLACCVDHIGGRSTRRACGIRDKVRGLCCPDGVCNSYAGRIEANLRLTHRVLQSLKIKKFPLKKFHKGVYGLPLYQ